MEIFRIYSFDTIMLIAFAVFFYKAADIEGASKLIWPILSIIVSLITRALSFELFGLILSQIALFSVITVIRPLLSKKK